MAAEAITSLNNSCYSDLTNYGVQGAVHNITKSLPATLIPSIYEQLGTPHPFIQSIDTTVTPCFSESGYLPVERYCPGSLTNIPNMYINYQGESKKPLPPSPRRMLGAKETHICPDGSTFTCQGGTYGCADNCTEGPSCGCNIATPAPRSPSRSPSRRLPPRSPAPRRPTPSPRRPFISSPRKSPARRGPSF